MSDDPSKRGAADRARINPAEDYEIRYWSDRLGVTPEELKKAVERVGPMVTDVEKALGG
jgi:hypothetical protein